MYRKLTAALVAAGALSAQTAPAGWEATGMKLAAAGQYLAAADTFRAAAIDSAGKMTDDIAFQYWAQITPFMINELPLDFYDRNDDSAPDTSWRTAIASATPRPALAEIVRRARATRIVILNEAHVSPRDRAFALQIARALRPLGYTTLAAEAITMDQAAALGHDGFARLGTGYYTRDPVFAGFLREAMAMGYRPVGYDPPLPTWDQRERAAADNLMRQIFATDPGAKLLLYVGHGHIQESARPGRGDAVAARIKRLTGVDPLTIEQTTVTDRYPHNRPAYDAAAARIREPTVFFTGNQPLVLGYKPGDVDLQVIHPRRAYRYGRPTWLATLGGKPTPVPARLIPTAGRRLVQAFAADAPADAVPLDQVLLTGGKWAPMLMVPKTKSRFATQDAP
ncbi:hypothetical protein GGQ80_002807 [Sphingomonas jinjuensis]|uniref:Uncharacterized protein n=1 Tax=Sphingomonas jinjuensis TaxID=535907 RepID=A0A840FDM5_9SPHN|nr:hypothetical protein [Sphingomonas jinjuensis]MBB4154891.1 hypothetical protein [Sphingomonas jinjuensis]